MSYALRPRTRSRSASVRSVPSPRRRKRQRVRNSGQDSRVSSSHSSAPAADSEDHEEEKIPCQDGFVETLERSTSDQDQLLTNVEKQTTEYRGENCLHIAIVNQNIELVKLLVEACPNQLHQEVTGNFFSPGKPCYYGGYPLSFAVSTNQPDILLYLLDKKANMEAQDHFCGNTAMHMAVIHGMKDMYDLLAQEWTNRQKIIKTPSNAPFPQRRSDLSMVRNAKGESCLTLAASVGSKEMFQHVLETNRQTLWKYGPVTCTLYDLEELDPLDPTSRRGALEHLILQERLELISLLRIKDLVDRKWAAFGRRQFVKKSLGTIGYIIVFLIAVLLPRSSRARAVFELLLVALTSRNTWKHVREVNMHDSIRDHVLRHGVAKLQSVSSLACMFSILIAIWCRISGGSVIDENAALSILSLGIWFNLLWVLLGFRFTGHYVIMLYNMIISDMGVFLMIAFVFLGGFSTSFHLLGVNVGEGNQGLLDQVEYCIAAMLGSFELETYRLAPYRRLTTSLALIYVVLLSVLLVNMLIAKMGDTYARISDEADKRWQLEKARLIWSMERSMTGNERRCKSCVYWVSVKGKRYLQVEEVDHEHWDSKRQ
eukprot:jgi/Bigna1/139376/aug1.50_g14084